MGVFFGIHFALSVIYLQNIYYKTHTHTVLLKKPHFSASVNIHH